MTLTYRVEPGFSMRVRPSSGLRFDTGLSANSGLKMAERGCTWGDSSETAKLLELWSEGGIQVQLRGMMRNEVPKDLGGTREVRVHTNIHAVPQKDKGTEEEVQGRSRPSNSKISFPFCIFPARYNVTKEHTASGPCPHHPFLTHAPQQQTPGHNSRDLLRKSAIRHLEVSALWRASPLLRIRLFRIQYKAKHRRRIAASFAMIERGTYALLRNSN